MIETYPCGNKDELVAKHQCYIRERCTLNNRTTTHATEQADAKTDILELRAMVHEMHAKINQIEDKLDDLLNSVYPSGTSTQTLDEEQEWSEDSPKETDTNRHEGSPKETATHRP